jgi:hypothetical protein
MTALSERTSIWASGTKIIVNVIPSLKEIRSATAESKTGVISPKRKDPITLAPISFVLMPTSLQA